MPWKPEQYHKFSSERSQPVQDLMILLQVAPQPGENFNWVDLGCGTGEYTSNLAKLFPDSAGFGVDNSESMLAKAKTYQSNRLTFQKQSIEDFLKLKEDWNLIFSNAALQWVENHQTLIPQLCGKLKSGGQLLVQVPANDDHPAYPLIHKIVQKQPYAGALKNWLRETPVLKPREYATLLYESGLESIQVFARVYPHILKNAESLVEWLKGTSLVPYLEKMPEELQRNFLEDYTQEIEKLFPKTPLFFGFQRILFSGIKS